MLGQLVEQPVDGLLLFFQHPGTRKKKKITNLATSATHHVLQLVRTSSDDKIRNRVR